MSHVFDLCDHPKIHLHKYFLFMITNHNHSNFQALLGIPKIGKMLMYVSMGFILFPNKNFSSFHIWTEQLKKSYSDK